MHTSSEECDLALACMPNLLPNTYWQQWLICAAGIVLVAFGLLCDLASVCSQSSSISL